MLSFSDSMCHYEPAAVSPCLEPRGPAAGGGGGQSADRHDKWKALILFHQAYFNIENIERLVLSDTLLDAHAPF